MYRQHAARTNHRHPMSMIGAMADRALRFVMYAVPLIVVSLAMVITTPNNAWANRVIEAGAEKEVLALFKPYGLGSTLTPGWVLNNISIQKTSITCTLLGPKEETATLTLTLIDDGIVDEGMSYFGLDTNAQKSFTLDQGTTSPEGIQAVKLLRDAVDKNDTGQFLERRKPPPNKRFLGGFFTDTLFLSLLALLLILLLGWRALKAAALWRYIALLVIVACGAAVRWWMAPEIQLGAWYSSRDSFLIAYLWENHSMMLVRDVLGHNFTQAKTISTLNFAYAVVTPIAIFIHARHLMGSVASGLIAAGLVAFLPMHIRFSQSEVAFIPSIVFSSLLFGLTHTCLKERSRVINAIALIALPLIAYAVFRARPLNIIFMPLIVVVAWGLLDKDVSKRKRTIVTIIVSIVGIYCAITELVAKYSNELQESTNIDTVITGFKILFSPTKNTLFNPSITSPLFTALCLWGAVVGLRSQYKRVTLFLLVWYVLFFFTHACIVPVAAEMQARYHLHLLVPTVFLSVIGLQWFWDRNKKVAVGIGIFLMFTPWMHNKFISDTGFNEHQEHIFVERMSKDIGDDCVVLEYIGDHKLSARFRRFGLTMTEEGPLQRFKLHSFKRPRGDDPVIPKEIRELIRNPGQCAYYYEGLQCWNGKEKSESIAPACNELRTLMSATKLASHKYPPKTYDSNQSKGIHPEQKFIELTLYQLHSASPSK